MLPNLLCGPQYTQDNTQGDAQRQPTLWLALQSDKARVIAFRELHHSGKYFLGDLW
jgi:hypothetical protein